MKLVTVKISKDEARKMSKNRRRRLERILQKSFNRVIRQRGLVQQCAQKVADDILNGDKP
jgi:hypothetical protein